MTEYTSHGSVDLAHFTLRWRKEQRAHGYRTGCVYADIDFYVHDSIYAYARFFKEEIRIMSRENELALFRQRMTLPADTSISDVVRAVISLLCISGELPHEDQI